MKDLTKFAALALGLSLATHGFAQETTTPEAPATEAPATDAPATEAPAADAAPSIEDGLSLGQDPNAPKDGPGTVYVAANHGAWELRCIRTEDGADPCQIYQLLKDEKGNAVAEISMVSLPDGQKAVAAATVIVPLETLLTDPLHIQVDGGQGKLYPYTFCTPQGCVSRVGFTAAEIAGFKKGKKASMTIVPVVAPDQKVVLNLSLDGFTAGYDAMIAANNK